MMETSVSSPKEIITSRAQLTYRKINILIRDLTLLVGEYKSEEHILSGKSICQDEWESVENDLFYSEFQHSSDYQHELGEKKNFEIFKEAYKNELAQAKEQMINNDLRQFYRLSQNLDEYELLFYASDGIHEFANSTKTKRNSSKLPLRLCYLRNTNEIFIQKKLWKINICIGLQNK